MSKPATESSREVQLLEFRARVSGDAELLRDLPTLYPPAPRWTTLPTVDVGAAFHLRPDSARDDQYQIVRDGEVLWTAARGADVLPALEWTVNTAAIEQLGERYLLFHAGAVALDGRGMILPATHGSGKTTLVAGLLTAGFQYFSDEVAAFEPGGLQLVPFAKSLTIKDGSRSVLAPYYTQLAADAARRRPNGVSVSYLPPPDGAWPAEAVPLRYVVLPKHVAGSETTLEPVSRSTALARLLEESFSLRKHGPEGVGRVVELLRSVECYSLTIGSLGEALCLVRELFATGD